jgi:hypothetical protein
VFDGYGHMLQFRAITFGVQGFMVVAISGMVISTSLNHQGAPLNHRISAPLIHRIFAHSPDFCSITRRFRSIT